MISMRVYLDGFAAEIEAADAFVDPVTRLERTFGDRGNADPGSLRVVQQRRPSFMHAPNRLGNLQMTEVVIAHQDVEWPRAEFEILEERLLPWVRLARDE